jgi:hypothetical protein
MTTKILIPRGSGEGGIGAIDSAWGQAYFDTGNFNKGLFVSGKNIQQVVSDVVAGGGLGGVWDSGPAGVIYYNGGNVGIGTTNPIGLLHVSNASENTISLTREVNVLGTTNAASCKIEGGALANTSPSMGGAIGFSLLDSDGPGTGVNTEGYLYFETKASGSGLTERMRIDSTGNVGIGTSSPITSLDIHGSLSFKSTGTYVSATNAGGDVNSNDLTLTAANSTNSIVARSAQNIIFQVFDPAPASVYREVMRITPWGAGGNVGIGTTNPGAKLEVAGNLKVNGKTSTVSENTGYDTIGGATAEVTLNSTSEDAMYLITASRHSTPTQAPTFETGYVVAHGVGNPIYYFQVLSGSNISISTSANKVIATNGAPSGIIYLSVLRLH